MTELEFEIDDLFSNRKYFDNFFNLPESDYQVFFSPFRRAEYQTCLFLRAGRGVWQIFDCELNEAYDLVQAIKELHKSSFEEAEAFLRRELLRKEEC